MMERKYTVALVGFAQHESATFEAFFRMAARRPPAYHVQDEVLDAQLLVVNADNPQAVELVREARLPGRVLLIGHHDAGTGWALVRKPVRLVSVLAEMDKLVGVRSVLPASAQRAYEPTEPFQASQFRPLDESMRRQSGALRPRLRVSSPDTEFPPTRPMVRRVPVVPVRQQPVHARVAPLAPSSAVARHLARPGVVRLTDFAGLDDLPTPAPVRAPRGRSSRAAPSSHRAVQPVREMTRGDTLLVSDSLVEGRILHKRFSRYGLKVDWSREGRQAEQMLQAHPYRLVVIDRVSGDPDAFQICRVARQQRLPNGQPPAVLMFAASAGSMERIKAGLAGADAYLSRSVSEAELCRHLAQHRLLNQNAFAPTDVAFGA